MKRNYETLDAIVVVAALLIIGGSVAGLFFYDVPGDNLPIISSLVGTILGTVIGGYAGFRWASSVKRGTQPVEVVNDPDKPVPVEEK